MFHYFVISLFHIFPCVFQSSAALVFYYSCDAGLFITEQFGGGYVKPALPLYSMGVIIDIDPAQCDMFPDSGECPMIITDWAPEFLANLSLSDINPDVSRSIFSFV